MSHDDSGANHSPVIMSNSSQKINRVLSVSLPG